MTLQAQGREIGKRAPTLLVIDVAERDVTAHDLRNLDIEQMRGVQSLPGREQTRVHAGRGR